MNPKRIPALAACLLVSGFLANCVQDGKHEDEEFVELPAERLYADPLYDTALGFTDIGALRVWTGDTSLNIEMTLAELPDTLAYNRTHIAANKLEYSWLAYLDMDRNDSESAGDLVVGLFRFKSDSIPRRGPLLSFTQKSVFRQTDSATARLIARAQVSVSGTTLTFSLGRAVLDTLGLTEVKSLNVPMKFRTQSFDVSGSVGDKYPQSGYAR